VFVAYYYGDNKKCLLAAGT